MTPITEYRCSVLPLEPLQLNAKFLELSNPPKKKKMQDKKKRTSLQKFLAFLAKQFWGNN